MDKGTVMGLSLALSYVMQVIGVFWRTHGETVHAEAEPNIFVARLQKHSI